MEHQDISLRDLHVIYREEMKKKIPAALDADFYARCQDHLSSLSSEMDKIMGEGDGPKTVMIREEMTRFKNTLDSIYSLRQRKILLMAYSINSGEEADVELLTPEERRLVEDCLCLLKDGKDRILGDRSGEKRRTRRLADVMRRRKRDTHEEPSVSKEKSRVETPPRPIPIEVAPKPHVNEGEQFSMVLVLEKIPPFMGYDMNYDLSPQDIALLPRRMASILAKDSKVQLMK